MAGILRAETGRRRQAGGGEEKKFLGIPVSGLAKFAGLGFMFFCILFNYTILRDTKDVLVSRRPGPVRRSSHFRKVNGTTSASSSCNQQAG